MAIANNIMDVLAGENSLYLNGSLVNGVYLGAISCLIKFGGFLKHMIRWFHPCSRNSSSVEKD